MPVTLTHVTEAKYLPELIPFGLVTTLAPSELQAVFGQVAGWNVRGAGRPRLLRLGQIAMAQAVTTTQGRPSDVRLLITADQRTTRLNGGAVPTWPDTAPDEVQAISSLAASVLNTSTVSTVPDLGIRFGLWVEPLETSDKVFWDVTLSEEDRIRAERLQIQQDVRAGILPLQPDDYVRLLDRRRVQRVSGPEDPVTITEDPSNVVATFRPGRPGHALVLRAIASNALDVAASANIQLALDRDGQIDYLRNLPLNLADLDHPYVAVIPATRVLTVRGYRASGTGSVGIQLRLQVDTIRLSDLLLARWEQAGVDQVGTELWDHVQGGTL